MNKNTQRRQVKIRKERLATKIAAMNESKRANLEAIEQARKEESRKARAAAEALKS